MFVDARSLPEGHRLETDVCVIGAGAAGITLARAFSGRRFRVCLLESGGLERDEETQALYAGESVGIPYFPLQVARLRYFGGTTNHWGGVCRPFVAKDFEPREWIPNSGWPLRLQWFRASDSPPPTGVPRAGSTNDTRHRLRAGKGPASRRIRQLHSEMES